MTSTESLRVRRSCDPTCRDLLDRVTELDCLLIAIKMLLDIRPGGSAHFDGAGAIVCQFCDGMSECLSIPRRDCDAAIRFLNDVANDAINAKHGGA